MRRESGSRSIKRVSRPPPKPNSRLSGGDAASPRFYDTFAVELLLQGTPLKRVSVPLGRSIVEVTARHCAQWVKERQQLLESGIRISWQPNTAAFELKRQRNPIQ